MPTRKEWVVDETGFHAKSVWESAPAKKSAVYPDDTSCSAENKENHEVELVRGTWLEGKEGFQFNKKCKVKVEAKFLKETSRKKVTIDMFVEYGGETEDLGQQVEAFFGDDGIAEAEVMLFYGDKYSKALNENPDATCRYTFKAKSNVAKKVLESEALEMPAGNRVDFKVTLQIDPNDEDSQDDTIRLFSTDDAKTYNTTLTVKDDKVAGDNCLTLEYTELDENLAYTLEVNPGNQGNIYYLFENKTLEEIANG